MTRDALAWWGAALVVVATLIVDPLAQHPYHAPKHYVLVVGSTLGLAVAARRGRMGAASVFEVALGVRVLWLALTHPAPSGIGLYVAGTLVVVAVVLRGAGRGAHMAWQRALVAVCVAQAAVGLVQGALIPPIASARTTVVGTVGTANGFAALLALGLVVAVARAGRRSGRGRAAYVSAAAIIGVALVANGSRGAAVAVAAAAAAAGLFRVRSRRLVPAVALATVAVATLVGALAFVDGASSRGRLMAWTIAVRMAGDHPVTGVGFGRFGAEYAGYQARYLEDYPELSRQAAGLMQAHNEALQAVAEGGLVGGGLFIAAWTLALFYGCARARERDAPPEAAVSALVLAAGLAHAAVDATLHVLPVAIVLSAAASTVRFPWAYSFGTRTPSYTAKTAALAAVAVAIALTAWQYPGHHHWRRAAAAVHEGDWERADESFHTANRRLPGNGEILFQQGAALVIGGDHRDAERGVRLLRASSHSYDDVNARLALSHGLVRLGRPDEAVREATAAAAAYPTRLHPLLVLAQAHVATGNARAAETVLNRCRRAPDAVLTPETLAVRRECGALARSLPTHRR